MSKVARAVALVATVVLALTACAETEVAVPNVIGMPLSEARSALSASGFETSFYEGEPADGDAAVVKGQVPAPDDMFREGGSVYLSFQSPLNATTGVEDEQPSSGVAQTACDHVGDERYPYGWKAHWLVGSIADRYENGGRFLKAEVTVKNEYGTKLDQTVECTVTGTNDAPNVTDFYVY